jgi:hypothetical protein
MRDNKVERYLYQFAIILDQFEGLNLTLTVLKISDIEQLNNEIFALLSTRFSYLKIAHLINQIGIRTLTAKKHCTTYTSFGAQLIMLTHPNHPLQVALK